MKTEWGSYRQNAGPCFQEGIETREDVHHLPARKPPKSQEQQIAPEAPPLPPLLLLPLSSSQSPGQAPPPDTPTVKHLNESAVLYLGAWVPQGIPAPMQRHPDDPASGQEGKWQHCVPTAWWHLGHATWPRMT